MSSAGCVKNNFMMIPPTFSDDVSGYWGESMEKCTSNPIQLSVIIVSYHCLSYLKDCLDSIEQHNDIGSALEVIVVDNSSTTEIVDWLRSNRPEVIAVQNDNRGFGQGNNVGAKLAHGQYLLFLNPDTLLIEPVFQFAVERFAADPKLGVFGLQLLNGEQEKTTTFGLRVPLGTGRRLLGNLCQSTGYFNPKFMQTSGADMFVDAAAFRACGMFDADMFMYYEESDICDRMNGIGRSVGLFREKRIVHLEGKTTVSKLAARYAAEMKSFEHYCLKSGKNFHRLGKKERRYCRMKQCVFSLLGNQDRAGEYRQIVSFWDQKLHP